MRRRDKHCLAGVIGIVILLTFGMGSGAMAASSFCPLGPGAGQCEAPEGLAVSKTSGNIYIADSGNNRVDVFSANGTFVRAFGWGVADGATDAFQVCTVICFKGIPGSGGGQFSAPSGIAVDTTHLVPLMAASM